MTDEPENLTLALLREIRGEMREGFEKAFGELGELRGSVSELSIAVADEVRGRRNPRNTEEPRRSPQRDRRPPRDYEGMRRRSPPQYSLGKKIVLF